MRTEDRFLENEFIPQNPTRNSLFGRRAKFEMMAEVGKVKRMACEGGDIFGVSHVFHWSSCCCLNGGYPDPD